MSLQPIQTPKIYILTSISTDLTIDSIRINPGIGGTQFTEITLAIALAQACPEYEVILVSSRILEINHDLRSSNLKIEVSKPLQLLGSLASSASDLNNCVIIGSQAFLESVPLKLLAKISSNTVAIIHHPYSFSEIIKGSKLAYCVAVGSFQFWSLVKFHPNLVFIQNLSYYDLAGVPKRLSSQGSESSPRLVFIGALLPEKGFHLIAQQWHAIKRNFPHARLDVIGGSATYGIQASHGVIPTTIQYANQLLEAFDGDLRDICFHGNLGAEKQRILVKSDLALLNPSGRSEAFPASPLECMAHGLPVIASNRLGMYDCMQFFPELVLSDPAQITQKIRYALGDPLRYSLLSSRSLRVASFFQNANEEMLMRWQLVIGNILSSQNTHLVLQPEMSSIALVQSLSAERGNLRSFARKAINKIMSSSYARSLRALLPLS